MPIGITLVLVTFSILLVAFFASGSWAALEASAPSVGLTPASRALALVLTPTSAPAIVVPLPTATATPIPDTPTATATPTPTALPPSPTATITPIRNTPLPAQPSPTSAVVPTRPLTVAFRYLPVVLLEPRHEQQVNGETTTFEWQDLRLQIGDHYELWLKRLASPTWEKRYLVADGKSTLSYQNAMDYGDYAWTVLIVDALGQQVSPIGEERKLLWRPRQPAGSQDSSSTSSAPFIKP